MCPGADTRNFSLQKTTPAIEGTPAEGTGCSKRLGNLPEATDSGRTRFLTEACLAFPSVRQSDLSPVHGLYLPVDSGAQRLTGLQRFSV